MRCHPNRLKRTRNPRRLFAVASLLAAAALLAACSATPAEEPTALPSLTIATPAPQVAAPLSLDQPTPYLMYNQRLIEGLGTGTIDLTDTDAVFQHVFASLPETVTVFPSENYYYFILNVEGRQVWGNIRLPAGERDNGVLSFGYYEFIEFPDLFNGQRLSGSKYYREDDGVLVQQVDRFTYTVAFQDHEVRFEFHELDQTFPTALQLDPDESFIQRTFDESGYQFYLVFDGTGRRFFWTLNEEHPVPDILDPVEEDLLVGRRSGFAFWVDPLDRKILVGVRRLNVSRNDYFDGPFDQLADNYAEETDISGYMQTAYPVLAGRIDKFGYYTDRDRPLRVGLSTYLVYSTLSELKDFVEAVRSAPAPYVHISNGARQTTD